MKREKFAAELPRLVPGCSEEAVKTWIESARENVVDLGHYVDFADENPNGDEAAIEDWLDSIYAGLGLIKERYNEEVALQIVELYKVPFCVLPYEMIGAAKHIANGGKPEDILVLSEEGKLDDIKSDNWPAFPKLEMLSVNLNSKETCNIAMI